jgi:hypothetical protein
MSKTFRPLYRCMACCRNRSEVVLSGDLELCLPCLQSRIVPVEPGHRFTVVLAIVESGYEDVKNG